MLQLDTEYDYDPLGQTIAGVSWDVKKSRRCVAWMCYLLDAFIGQCRIEQLRYVSSHRRTDPNNNNNGPDMNFNQAWNVSEFTAGPVLDWVAGMSAMDGMGYPTFLDELWVIEQDTYNVYVIIYSMVS